MDSPEAAASIREILENLFISKADSDITLVVHGEVSVEKFYSESKSIFRKSKLTD